MEDKEKLERSDRPKKDHTQHFPKILIDWKELDKLCALQCTQEEIAGWFNCSVETVATRIKEEHGVTFPEYFAQKRSGGKISLRRKQYETAMSGNPTMLIWLGKQYLNQCDKQEHEITAAKIEIVLPDERATKL